ncbi:AAA domain-containing protein [Seinonella peptonophila]|uniref:Nuclease SbcCD subunit C n=1 Tax=Seinonella peptonophila TaxID=112248 RepID=A0A1M4TAX4_9BACL|nr:AAA family ATPase [Seinonella peptonophila]SHE41397.1 AAA domain-containing protein [Seinonella peptonophila]
MSYFQRLVLENFQSHEYTELHFVEGLNVLVGPSDSGKSSVLRALRWVLFNQPRGSDFIREGAQQCRVSLTLFDGTEIIRIRGQKKALNRYILRRPGQPEQVLESLGTGPHPLILQAHGMYSLDGDTYVQIGSQLDPPFLLAESGGKKANLIGRISGAHWIDLALKKMKQKQNSLRTTLRQLEQQEAEIQDKLLPYENLTKLEDQLTSASERFLTLGNKRKRLHKLQELNKKYKQMKKEKQQILQLLDRFHQLPDLEQRVFYCEQQHWRLIQWKQIYLRYQQLREDQQKYRSKIDQTANIPTAEKRVQYVEGIFSTLAKLNRLYQQWSQFSQEKFQYMGVQEHTAQIGEADSKLQHLVHKHERLIELQALAARSKSYRHNRASIESRLQQTKESDHWNQRFQACEVKYQQLLTLRKITSAYHDNQNRLILGKKFIHDKQVELELFTTQYMDLLEQIGRCPTCGAAVHEASIEHVLG